jgi:hypothetical protein
MTSYVAFRRTVRPGHVEGRAGKGTVTPASVEYSAVGIGDPLQRGDSVDESPTRVTQGVHDCGDKLQTTSLCFDVSPVLVDLLVLFAEDEALGE